MLNLFKDSESTNARAVLAQSTAKKIHLVLGKRKGSHDIEIGNSVLCKSLYYHVNYKTQNVPEQTKILTVWW